MLRERMAGVCKGVQARGLPTFLAFQEVTPVIRALLAAMAPWWGAYSFSPEPPDMEYYVMLGCLLTLPVTQFAYLHDVLQFGVWALLSTL